MTERGRLDGQVAFVTGGGGGIGRAIALALAAAARKGLDARARWTAYLTSPDLLWS